MPETPKSALMFVSNERLREIVDCGRMWCGDRETQLLAAEVIRCRATLTQQAAAVPARQDASPEKEMKCKPCPGDPKGTGFCEFHECENDCQTAEPLSTQPTQAAVGGGETVPADVFNACMVRMKSLETERDLAIAQRDEATKESENLRRALAEAEFAILDTVNSAALDVPKPESGEIERLFAETSQGVWKRGGAACDGEDEPFPEDDAYIYIEIPPEKVGGQTNCVHVLFNADWATPEDAQFVVAVQNKFRLRSLPSEPGSGVQRRKK